MRVRRSDMKALLKFIIKEFYHITRDYRTLLVLFGMPAIQLFIFGYAIRTEINDADIGIVDKSKDYVTSRIIEKLLSSGYFHLNGYYKSEDMLEKAFQAGKIKQAIIFEPNFGDKLVRENKANIQLIADASNPNVATMLISYSTSIIADFNRELNEKSGGIITINAVPKMLFNPEMKSVYMFVPGLLALIIMLISALMTSIAITREKEFGTMEVLLVSPLKPLVIIIGKVVPYLSLAFIIALIILSMAIFIFKVPFLGSFPLFLGITALFILTALSLGILISTMVNSQQVAMMISLAGLLMPSVLLSGFIFPIDNMPVILQWISIIIPARWFLVIIKDIMLKGLG
ncbi:MAG: drug efflux transport system permease protein, partial [Bacteroidota bacterium]|nr:drug efflux transport system permease protein [Bacteroidota bacterium]